MFAIAIHGGAGTLSRNEISEAQERVTPNSSAVVRASMQPSPQCVSWRTTRCSMPDAAQC